MTKTEINVNSLLDFQYENKLVLKGIENHYDEITGHIGFIHAYISTLMGPAIVQGSSNLRLTKEAVMSGMRKVLHHLLALCTACNYEIPDKEDLEEAEEEFPYEEKIDLVLALSGMLSALMDIMHIVHIDVQGAIWAEEEVPEDFETDIINIILGIKNIGEKYGFTLEDLL